MQGLERAASKRVLKHVNPKKRKSKKRKGKKRTQKGGKGFGEMGGVDDIFKSVYNSFNENRKLVKKHFGRKKNKKQSRKKQKGKKKPTLGSVVREAYKEFWPYKH